MITSRAHGSYRLVPVSPDDTLIDAATLEAKIRQGIADYEAGKVYRMNEGLKPEENLSNDEKGKPTLSSGPSRPLSGRTLTLKG